jgi:spore maturation protein CgeB
MRVAIYYDTFPETGYRNDGNPVYVWAALKRMQEKGLLEVDHLAPKKDVNLFGTYDVNLWVDYGEDALASIIPYPMIDCPHPNVYWASDTHLGFDYRFETAKKFDVVFCAQKQAVLDFQAKGVHAEWLPHAFEPMAYHDIESGTPVPYNYANKDYDACFIGHINSPNRVDFLDRMFKEFPNFFFGQRRFQEAAQKFCKSKIVLNIAMKEDLNMRCLEAMGSGSFLLTDYVPYIEELFEDGKHLVLYRSLDEAVDKAKYYLKHDSEREKIAQAGFEEVMAKHTIDHRVNRMLEAVKDLNKVAV